MEVEKTAMKYLVLIMLVLSVCVSAKTPKLNITLKHDSAAEQRRKEQLERLAEKYDLAKYTITRDTAIDQQAMNHSSPALTPNLRSLDQAYLAVSASVPA